MKTPDLDPPHCGRHRPRCRGSRASPCGSCSRTSSRCSPYAAASRRSASASKGGTSSPSARSSWRSCSMRSMAGWRSCSRARARFGAELDSLTDFVNFGVAPAVLIHLWSLQCAAQSRLDRGAGACHLLRPATGPVQRVHRRSRQARLDHELLHGYSGAGGSRAGDGADVSRFPRTHSERRGRGQVHPALYRNRGDPDGEPRADVFREDAWATRISRELVLPILGIAAFSVAMLIAFTWEMLAVCAILYLGSIPLSIRSYYRQQQAYQERTGASSRTKSLTNS